MDNLPVPDHRAVALNFEIGNDSDVYECVTDQLERIAAICETLHMAIIEETPVPLESLARTAQAAGYEALDAKAVLDAWHAAKKRGKGGKAEAAPDTN